MSKKAANAYASNDIHGGVSSDPEMLVVLVFERVIDHLKLGKGALEQGEYGIEAFTKANDLIQKGLLACLDYSQGKEIAQNLAAIYEWSLRAIIQGRADKSPQKIQEVIDVLTPLYEGWLSLADRDPVHFSQTKSVSGLSLSAA
jgi:flagellar protein FliS